MNLEYTKSNLSFLSSRLLQISSWINSIFCLEVMLRLQYSKYLLSISTPTTCPVSPTILAISLVTEPEPHPISMQLMPFFRPAFKSVCFVIGSIRSTGFRALLSRCHGYLKYIFLTQIFTSLIYFVKKLWHCIDESILLHPFNYF